MHSETKRYKTFLAILPILAITILLFGDVHSVFAAGVSSNSDFTTQMIGGMTNAGLNSTTATELTTIANTMFRVAYLITSMLTVVAGLMVGFGIDDGKKLLWQWILGLGLAVNFGVVMYDLFVGSGLDIFTPSSELARGAGFDPQSIPSEITKVQDKASGDNGATASVDVLSQFMSYYLKLIHLGMYKIVPIATRMTLLFAAIDGAYKLATEMISGDKIKFMISTTVKVGFFLFLIHEWLTLSWALNMFFQQMGFLAGGQNIADVSIEAVEGDATKIFQADSIVNNAFVAVNLIYSKAHFSILDPIVTLGSLVCMIAIVVAIFYTALQMFMARIEFYTMMLLSVVMLPFGMIDKLAFLSNQAIGGMFSLSAKVMVIAFIESMSVTMLNNYMSQFNTVETGNFTVLMQIVLFCCILAVMVKKIPDMVQGFLSGSPSLSGGDMKQMLAQTVQNAGKVAAAVATGGAGAKALGGAMSQAAGATGGFGSKAGAKAALGVAGRAAVMAVGNKVAGSGIGKALKSGKDFAYGKDGYRVARPETKTSKEFWDAVYGNDWGRKNNNNK